MVNLSGDFFRLFFRDGCIGSFSPAIESFFRNCSGGTYPRFHPSSGNIAGICSENLPRQSGENYGFFPETFDANGHGTAPEPETAWSGETINSPTPDYVKGYSFGGWYTEKECIHRFNFDTPITCNITLYAKWSTTSTITYDANGGIKGPYWFDKYEVPADKTVTATVTEEPPDMFIKAPDGYVFCGFEIDGVIYRPGQTYTIMPVKDITFRYLWKSAAASDHVTVTYSGADYVPDPSVVETGSEYTVSDDRAISSGKVFRGWARPAIKNTEQETGSSPLKTSFSSRCGTRLRSIRPASASSI
ncbi:MAG: InlB B-repeat-containing protein [Methanosarcinaceae archaeon]|nr:InlB B-repeat-containing protein [Methanosarcinaceae archaeon]